MVKTWILTLYVMCYAITTIHATLHITSTSLKRKRCVVDSECGPSMYCERKIKIAAKTCRQCSFAHSPLHTSAAGCVTKGQTISLGEAVYEEATSQRDFPVCDQTIFETNGVDASCMNDESSPQYIFIGAVCTISCSTGYVRSESFVSAAKCHHCTTKDEGCFWNVTLTDNMCVPIATSAPVGNLSESERIFLILGCFIAAVLVIVVIVICGIKKCKGNLNPQTPGQTVVLNQDTPVVDQPAADSEPRAETEHLINQTTPAGDRTSSLDSDSGYSENSQDRRPLVNPTVNVFQNNTTIQNFNVNRNTIIADRIERVLVQEREPDITEEQIESSDCDQSVILGEMTLSNGTDMCKELQNTSNSANDCEAHTDRSSSVKHREPKSATSQHGDRQRVSVDSGYGLSRATAYSQVDSTGSQRSTSSQQEDDTEIPTVTPFRSVPYTSSDFQKPIPRPCDYSNEPEPLPTNVSSTEATRGSPPPQKSHINTSPVFHDSDLSSWSDKESQAQESEQSDFKPGPLNSDSQYGPYMKPGYEPTRRRCNEPHDSQYYHIHEDQSSASPNYFQRETNCRTNIPSRFRGLNMKVGSIGNVEYHFETEIEAPHQDQVNEMHRNVSRLTPRIAPVDLDVQRIENFKSVSRENFRVVCQPQHHI